MTKVKEVINKLEALMFYLQSTVLVWLSVGSGIFCDLPQCNELDQKWVREK